jgi:putative phosphoribosyl transferase
VAFEVAKALDAPLDVFLVQKMGVPGREELAMGAIASGGVRVLNQEVIRALDLSEEVIGRVAREQRRKLERRARAYRGDRPKASLEDQTVILVDDGLATGASMEAAVKAVKKQSPSRVIVAVPAGPSQACEQIEAQVDEFYCIITPEPFLGVGRWYDDFPQISDERVRQLLEHSDSLRPL